MDQHVLIKMVLCMIKKNNGPRKSSIIIGLNDNFEGGEISFPYQNEKIKICKGEAILFPPEWSHVHYTNDLQNRTYRFTINTWLHERLHT